jgi:hypothetical protein
LNGKGTQIYLNCNFQSNVIIRFFSPSFFMSHNHLLQIIPLNFLSNITTVVIVSKNRPNLTKSECNIFRCTAPVSKLLQANKCCLHICIIVDQESGKVEVRVILDALCGDNLHEFCAWIFCSKLIQALPQ